jgi:hypothetical protein
VGWPGSVADGRVFANSYLKTNLEQLLSPIPSFPVFTKASSTTRETQQENVPAFILADSAYPSTSRVVPTFKNYECSNRDVNKLNKRLSSVRYIVEQAFGVCKGRFRLLNRPLECAKDDIVRASYLITAIFVVHNYLIDENDDTPVEMIASDEENNSTCGDASFPGSEDGEDFQGLKMRDILLRHSYWRHYQ